MLVVDASCLYQVVADTEGSDQVRRHLAMDSDQAAPHLIDIEVASVVRRDYLLGLLDATTAAQAIDGLRNWPADRYGHQALLGRIWELRYCVRGWDAAYVALAEALDATLLTADARLSKAAGPRCPIELVQA
ncbi:MAG: type II toxin-antitoxin system VapC family toxin [Actinomycetota bacterium]